MSVKHGARALRWIPLLALPVLAGAVVFASTTREAGEFPAAGLVIPRPDLSALSETARAKIETMQSTLDDLSSAGSERAGEITESFGLLGQMFHAFDLLDSAAICYRNALELAPDDPRWTYYQALVRNSKGELEAAVEGYRKAIELTPDHLAAHIRLGNALLELGLLDEAEAALTAAQGLDPESAAAFYGLGQAAAAAGRTEAAVTLLEQALARQPEASIVHYPLAQAHRRLGNAERAEYHLGEQGNREVSFPDRLVNTLAVIAKSTALEVVGDLARQPDFDERGFLGFVLSQFRNDLGAVEQLQKVIEHLESTGQGTAVQIGRIRYGIGGLMVAQERGDEAIGQFEKALFADAGLLDARVKLGNAYARGRRFDDAIAAYSKVLEARPEDGDVLLKRATAFFNQQKLDEARADLERLTGLAPAGLEGRLLLVAVLERLDEGQAAVDTLILGLEAQAEDAGKLTLHTELAGVYRRQGQFEIAAREYLQALKLDDRHVPALGGLASLFQQLGYYAQAAYTYEKWVTQEPANVAARVAEATSLIMAEAYGRAAERLEDGLAEVPGSLDLKDLLARHLAACPDRAVRNGERALELALEVYDAVPSLESMETVAMAYAEADRHAEAVDWQKRLIAGAGDEAAAADLGRWRSNLGLYERGEACCVAVN